MTSTINKLNNMNPAAHDANLGTLAAALAVLANSLKNALLNACYSNAGLAIGATSPKKGVTITNTTVYTQNGVFKSKTTAEAAFTATVHDIPADAAVVQEAVYLVSLNNGTPVITMGVIANGAGTALIPSPPAGHTPIGHVRIAVDAGVTPFDATSDDLDAGHLTVTYTNVALLADKLGADAAVLT